MIASTEKLVTHATNLGAVDRLPMLSLAYIWNVVINFTLHMNDFLLIQRWFRLL